MSDNNEDCIGCHCNCDKDVLYTQVKTKTKCPCIECLMKPICSQICKEWSDYWIMIIDDYLEIKYKNINEVTKQLIKELDK